MRAICCGHAELKNTPNVAGCLTWLVSQRLNYWTMTLSKCSSVDF